MQDFESIGDEVEEISPSESFILSPEQCCPYLSGSENGLKIFHVNIRSIKCNFDHLLIMLNRLNYSIDVIILTECWLSKIPVIPDLAGFGSHETSYTNQNDGVVVYVGDHLQCTVDKPTFAEANCIILKFKDLALVALYRSPSHRDIRPFIDSLDATLKTLVSHKTVGVIGDINLNILEPDPQADQYLNLLAEHGMLPAHLFPTRGINCLDHVILRTKEKATTIVLDSMFTDHAPVILVCDLKLGASRKTRTSVRIDHAAVVADLQQTDFSSVLNALDAEDAATELITTIAALVKVNSNSITIPSRKRILKPWITPGLLRCIRNRDKLQLKSRKDPENPVLKITFTRYKTFCNKMLKKVKTCYERGELQKASGNPKKTWDLVKQFTNFNQKLSQASSELLTVSHDPASSVNTVNEFFAGVGKKLASKLIEDSGQNNNPQGATESSQEGPSNSMVLVSIDDVEIEYIINNLRTNCAVGWDGIPTSILKAAKCVLIPVITRVCNLCLSTGIFPRVFKKAIVHPIHKKGAKDNIDNYRPISVLSSISKIFEKVLNKRLIRFLDKNEIFANNQYGFRPGRSTEDAIMDLLDSTVHNIDQRIKTIGIFLDLSKAFDTVSIPILITKLEAVGVRGVALDIFKSYLSDRSQCVIIDGHISKEESLNFGVPQGSVLGPTLFLAYINDLCRLSLPKCKIITNADDTALLIEGKDWLEAGANAETALRRVMNWLISNLLTLNVEKTKFVAFGSRIPSLPPASFSLRAHICDPGQERGCGCGRIARTRNVKYLGIVIDEVLSWHEQIAATVGRVRKILYVFRYLRCIANQETLKSVYFVFVQSILGYCIPAWGGVAKNTMLRLERAGRSVLKVMLSKPIRYPTFELYRLCNVLTVRQLFVRQVILKRHVQLSFDVKLTKNKRRSDRVCESLPRRTALASRHFLHLSSMLYNKINKAINIYPLPLRECKTQIFTYLQSRTFEETENLLRVLS